MIPDQLGSDTPTFIRLAERSKAPKRGNSADTGPFFHRDDSEIVRHLGSGGNVGRVLRDDLVAIDVDSQDLLDRITELPDTFVVESGGSGLGYHYYYRCPGWSGNQRELTADRRNLGSIRSGNSYCLVPPSVHNETREEYETHRAIPVAEVEADQLESVLGDWFTANTGGGAAPGAGGGRRKGADEPLPEDYPNRSAQWSTLRNWLASNELLNRLNQTASEDWSGDEFVVAKCLAEGGFSPESIRSALDRFNHRSKWHRRGEDYRSLTVQKAIEAADQDEYVDWSDIAYKPSGNSQGGERRKTEIAGEDGDPLGGEKMTEFTEKKNVINYEGDGEDGDSAVKAALIEGTDDDGETFEYVQVATGKVEESQTVDGGTALVPQINDDPGQAKSVGSPENIRAIATALQQLADEIDQ